MALTRTARVEARPGLPTRLAPSAQQHDGPHHARPHGSLPLQAVLRRVQQRACMFFIRNSLRVLGTDDQPKCLVVVFSWAAIRADYRLGFAFRKQQRPLGHPTDPDT